MRNPPKTLGAGPSKGSAGGRCCIWESRVEALFHGEKGVLTGSMWWAGCASGLAQHYLQVNEHEPQAPQTSG